MQRSKARRPSAIAIELQIDGETWHRVDALDESGPDDRHFVVITDDNGIANIRFGDGKHGSRLPTRTDRIAAVYGSSKRFVAVVQQQGCVIVDKDWNEGSDSEDRPERAGPRAGTAWRRACKPSRLGNAVPARRDRRCAADWRGCMGRFRGRRSDTACLDRREPIVAGRDASTRFLTPRYA